MPSDLQNPDNADSVTQSQYYRRLFDCAGVVVIGTDHHGIIASWNRAAENIFHTDSAIMVGRALTEVLPDDCRSEMQQAIQAATKSGQTSEFEIELPQPDDQEMLSLAVTVAAIIGEANEPLGLAVCMNNITRRKKLEHQLLEAEKSASLGTLASGVAHHFNNIIGGVATFVDYAITSGNPHTSLRALQMTAEAANRISHITESLLTFAAMDMRHFDVSDLTEVVLTFSHLVEKPLADKNIKLELSMQPIPTIEVAGSRMHQVLGNLLDNAESAMPEGGTVTLDLRQQGEHVELRFVDTGCGITSQNVSRVFEPFFTTHGVDAEEHQSSIGLGLSVVQGIIHEFGATIEVESRPAGGTTFIICFPVTKR